MIYKDKGLLSLLGDNSLTNIKFKKFLKESTFELYLLVLLNNNINLKIFREKLLYKSEEIYNFRKVTKIVFSTHYF